MAAVDGAIGACTKEENTKDATAEWDKRDNKRLPPALAGVILGRFLSQLLQYFY
jgi:hypothetical protein